MEQTSLEIEGMSCEHCRRAVRHVLPGLAGVEAEKVEIGSAMLRYDPARISAKQVAQAIDRAGYSAREHASGP